MFSSGLCAVVEWQLWLRLTFSRSVEGFGKHLHGLTYAELLVLLLVFVPKVLFWSVTFMHAPVAVGVKTHIQVSDSSSPLACSWVNERSGMLLCA